MIIYGSRKAHLQTHQLGSTPCSNCGTRGSLLLNIYRKHAHIYWIPLFPLGKLGYSQCQHCKELLHHDEMPAQIKKEYLKLKEETRGPIWQFIGIALFLALMVWVQSGNREQDKIIMNHLTSPQEGDIYKYEIEKSRYSTFKIIRLTEDSLIISPNEYEINSKGYFQDIDKAENYMDISEAMTKDHIKKMYESGKIIAISR